MKKIGLFLGDVLVKEYPRNPEYYVESANDLLEVVKETYAFHELKLFESKD